MTNGVSVRAIAYDARGNSLTETRPGSVAVAATYDGYARLTTYDRTGELSQANSYSGLDERPARTVWGTVRLRSLVSVTTSNGITSDTRRYVYDPDELR